MVAIPCQYLYNCVDTISAENTEMPISQDLRKRIVALHEQGSTGYAIAKQLMLSQTSVGRIVKLYKETGGTKPRPREYGPRPVISDEILARIKQEIDADSSTTIPKIMEKLQLSCCSDTVRNAIIKRLGYTCKKKRWLQRSGSRPPMPEKGLNT
jgi:transposase